jgi:FdhD protein
LGDLSQDSTFDTLMYQIQIANLKVMFIHILISQALGEYFLESDSSLLIKYAKIIVMDDTIGEDFEILEISLGEQGIDLNPLEKRVISEMSLKIIINGDEYASLLCLNQYQEELALGFLYSEGVIDSFDAVESVLYHERLHAVVIQLKEGIGISHQESLRSMTSGCGKCYTYINPLKQDKYKPLQDSKSQPIRHILDLMKKFELQSEIYAAIGGVHNVLYHSEGFSVLNEDIGRHNCVDKITGILLKNGRISEVGGGIMFISGRVSSEIMTKIIRLQIPILVSRSTPTNAAVRLARQYRVTLLGYVRGSSGYIYSNPERLSV